MKKKTFPLLLLLTALLLCAGCARSAEKPRTATFFAMDTVMELTVYGGPGDLTKNAETLIRALEAEFSVTDPSSGVSLLNAAGEGPVHPDTEKLLRAALSLSERTGGALDCTVYPVLRAWGFTTGDCRVPSGEELRSLVPLTDWRKIKVSNGRVTLGEGQMLDFGAVAKGYAGDRLLALFREAGVTSALVNLGGNVQTLGTKPDGSPWRVAVEDPDKEGAAGVIETADRAVITSGGYERYFEQNGRVYAHILDPATGVPADSGLLSVTVVGESGVVCDGLSTALYVMGEERAAALWRESDDFEAVLLTADGRIVITEGLGDAFTPAGRWTESPLTVIRHAEN